MTFRFQTRYASVERRRVSRAPAFIYLNGRLPQDVAKSFTGECQLTLGRAGDSHRAHFCCARERAIEQAFASDEIV